MASGLEVGLWLLFGNVGIACGTIARLLTPALMFLYYALQRTLSTWKEFKETFEIWSGTF